MIGDALGPGVVLGACLPRRRATAIGIRIWASASLSVLAPGAVGSSAGSESGTRGFHDSFRIVDAI